ncbi:glycosyltransferase [Candidatus Saccharibacteria bacterium]|nr:glycosyltransferase [Candidatus Saccharibacteria bacterium]
MKIVIATAVYYPMINGVANFSHHLAEGLARRGHQVLVITPSQTGKNYSEVTNGVRTEYLNSIQLKLYPDQIHGADDEGIDVRAEVEKELPRHRFWRGKLHFPWYRHGLRVSVFPRSEITRILDDFCPDVVHIQVSDPIGLSVAGFARKRGIPVVTTEHNQPEVLTSSLHLGILRRPANYLLATYFRSRQKKSDFVTMPTERAILHLLSGHEPLAIPIAAVSNGVDLTHFTPGEADGEVYRKYGLNKKAHYILYVGRVDPEKRVGDVIKAFNEARRKLPKSSDPTKVARPDSGEATSTAEQARPELPADTHLLIVGDGTDLPRLRKMVTRMKLEGKVKFLGKVLPPDLYEIYKVGSAFATASPVETQGIVLIEAAATGLPLIAVDKGATSEICKDGENGCLCRAGDISQMASAIREIMTDDSLRAKYSKASLALAREHDLERTLDKFLNIYRRVLLEKKK